MSTKSPFLGPAAAGDLLPPSWRDSYLPPPRSGGELPTNQLVLQRQHPSPRSFTASDLSRQQIRSTGPTETVSSAVPSIRRSFVSATAFEVLALQRQYPRQSQASGGPFLTGLSTASAAVLVQARTVPHSTNSTCPRQDSTPFIKQAL
jgi:hypothetical protein